MQTYEATFKLEVGIDVEVYCDKCGDKLDTAKNPVSVNGDNYGDSLELTVYVYPCQKCIDNAVEEAQEEMRLQDERNEVFE